MGAAAMAGIFLAAAAAAFAGAVALRTPRADRDWAADQAVAARVSFGDGGRVSVHDVRDFSHEPDGTFTEAYRDVTFGPGEVLRVWLVVAPFAKRWRGLAHTFLTFELSGGRHLAVSVEARREQGEAYSLLGGLMRRFEVTYVVGTERDLIGLRALRGDTLYLYPARAAAGQAEALLRDMLRRAESVRIHPEFYNTLLNNCTTNLRDHVNRIAAEPLPWGWGLVFPGYADELALDRGLLDTDLPLDEARRRFRVDEAAREALARGGDDFSRAIRAEAPEPPGPPGKAGAGAGR